MMNCKKKDNKIGNSIKRRFDSEPVCNKNLKLLNPNLYLKLKIKSYEHDDIFLSAM